MWTDGTKWQATGEDTERGITVRTFACDHADAASGSVADVAIRKGFALGVFFGTCESRGLVASRLLMAGACAHSLVVLFGNRDSRGLRDRYDSELLKQVKRCTTGGCVTVISGVSENEVDETLVRIAAAVPANAWGPDSEWFMDISAAPIPHFLGILGQLRRRPLAPRVQVFHPGGHYEKNEKDEAGAFAFTSGFEGHTWVPYMWGSPVPSLPWAYLFLLGFEGNRSYEIFDRFEPDYVEALIPKPGYQPDYARRTTRENRRFLDAAKPVRCYAPASDVNAAWRRIRNRLARMPEGHNLCIVPLGPKPHALAGGLAALRDGRPSVLCTLPRSYWAKDTAPGPRLWTYEISL
jgi:hypothetical protein